MAAGSPARTAEYSARSRTDGSAAATDRSSAARKSNWTMVGRSHHNVPSLSKVATRSLSGSSRASARNCSTASRTGPGHQEGSVPPSLACASDRGAEPQRAERGLLRGTRTGSHAGALGRTCGVRPQVCEKTEAHEEPAEGAHAGHRGVRVRVHERCPWHEDQAEQRRGEATVEGEGDSLRRQPGDEEGEAGGRTGSGSPRGSTCPNASVR